MKPAIGLLLFLGTMSLQAQEEPQMLEQHTVLLADGANTMAVSFHHLAVGFELEREHHHVAIAARLGNGGGRAEVDAYLVRAIGPDAKESDEVARTAFELSYPFNDWVDIFNDLELQPGKYWLILAKPPESTWSSINWFAVQPAEVRSTCSVHLGNTATLTFETDEEDYVPASKFESKYTPYAYQLEITELWPAGTVEQCQQTVIFGKRSSR